MLYYRCCSHRFFKLLILFTDLLKQQNAAGFIYEITFNISLSPGHVIKVISLYPNLT